MKKKFTMLFAALLAFVGVAKADVTDLPQISTVENPIYYTIVNTRSSQPGGLMYYAGDNVGLKDEQAIVLEDKHKFFFTGSHEEMYVHNAATGLKLASVSSWTEAGAAWTVGVSPKGGGLAFGPKGGLNSNDCWNEKNFATDANTSDFTTWSANDDGSIFIVDLAEDYVFPVSDLFYVIEAPLFEKVQGVKKALYVNAEGKAAWATEDLKNNNFYWIPTVKDGKVALKNLGTDTYLSNTDGDMTDAVAEATLKILGDCSFNINIGEGTLHANGHGNGASANGTLTSWGGSAGSASAWRFVQKNDPTALVEVAFTYSFVYEGEEKCSQNCNTFVGEEYPAITVAFPYGVSAVKPDGEVTADIDGKKVTINLSVNLPFSYAATTAPIDENWGAWYYIKNKNLYYLHHDEELNHIPLSDNEKVVDAENKDAYSWAFVGDPFTGFQLVNKAAGIGKILTSSTTIDGDGANTFPTVGVMNSSDKNSYWVLSASSHAENGFFMEQQGHTSHKMNNRGNKLAYWTGGADLGSTFTVELRDDSEELQALVDEATELLVALGEGTAVGCVTADSKTAISNAIAAANTAIENKTNINEAQVALNAAIAALETIQPEVGKYYVISSAMPESDGRSGQSIYVNENGGMNFSNEEGASKLFQFVSAGEGKFYLYNVENGSYLNTAKGHSGGQAEAKAFATDGAKAVTITNMGRSNAVKIVPEGGAMLHAQAAGSTVVAWNNDDNAGASAWTIAEVEVADHAETFQHTLTVTEAGWATLVLGYNTTIPAGVKAYAVSSIAEGKAVLAEVADVLPAHTPVLIEAVANDYTFEYTATEATVESNLLAGSVFNITVEGDGYVLAAKGENVGLYKAILNEGKFTNKANKAYLPAPADGNAPAMFVFSRGGEDEDATGIDQLINANGELVIYDLSGRRVEKMEKGIYIVNGKKVVK
ncbi:MAG: hypothetical protein IKY64_02585 [Bacteroidaceae bacterium]|nr:hypothetical protein [Bacteroidaceae bacterium]